MCIRDSFDAANRTAVKMIAKTWLRTAKIKDVGAYFAVSDINIFNADIQFANLNIRVTFCLY